jgi:predicted nucleic acid-binding protein
MRFVDTNVLLYAIGTNRKERRKTDIASGLLEHGDLGLSVQVLQEFYVQATRPSRQDRLSHNQASALVEAFLRFSVQEITVAVMNAALLSHEHFQISYWDAAILEAARSLGCNEVLSEDLSDGQDYGGVVVVDPFRE